MPGLIAMTSVFVVVGIEMVFASRGAGHVHSTDYEALGRDDHHASPRPPHKKSHSYGRYSNATSSSNGLVPGIVMHDLRSSDNLMAGRSPSLPSPMTPTTHHASTRVERESMDDDDDSDLEFNPEELVLRDVDDCGDDARMLPHPGSHDEVRHPRGQNTDTSENNEAQNRKQLLQCILLEAGILFHSVFIGMALSVATGTSFAVLLVAISFHQTFEGFALGSRISAIRFPGGSMRPWLMALAYGTTTPIGQAIGLAIHTLYDPASQIGLLTVGFMNAISSGLLLFAGLVELLAEDFLSDESYVTLRGKRRLQACGSVVSGAALMALVGAWA
jgi:zinc transporter 1/2/3